MHGHLNVKLVVIIFVGYYQYGKVERAGHITYMDEMSSG